MAHLYENAEPIGDPHCVLDLLYHDRQEWRTDRRLHVPRRYTGDAYVRLMWEYRVQDYRVAPGVETLLLADGLVEGKKEWGYTDNTNLSISDLGKRRMWEIYAELGVPFDDKFHRRLRTEDWIHAWRSFSRVS